MINQRKKRNTITAAGLFLLVALFSASTFPSQALAASIGATKAKSIAMEDAGVKASDVKVVKQLKFRRRGQDVYEIIFISDGGKYRYQIDAETGEILSNYEYGFYNSKNQTTTSSNTSSKASASAYIGKEKAKEIALGHAGVSAKSIRKYESKLKKKSYAVYYEIEFEYQNYDYEYKIDAYTGDVIEWDIDD